MQPIRRSHSNNTVDVVRRIGEDVAAVKGLKRLSFLVPQNSHGASPPRPDQQIVPAISVQIGPGHARPALTELAREQWLPGEVIEGQLDVCVAKRGKILKPSRATRWSDRATATGWRP